ncbi:hypothetical protein E2C01_060858 [Portunus trituberculatus]|uniref:Uncharacterized protein n=1 Tax=Portunus trituberculatus TaxID=210409 RepID=A0A5B7H9U7_PORTR|nr:hypothetical protein [Portunus trituberculatus]
MALAEGVTTTTVMDHCRSKPAHLHLKSMHRPRTTSSMWGLNTMTRFQIHSGYYLVILYYKALET